MAIITDEASTFLDCLTTRCNFSKNDIVLFASYSFKLVNQYSGYIVIVPNLRISLTCGYYAWKCSPTKIHLIQNELTFKNYELTAYANCTVFDEFTTDDMKAKIQKIKQFISNTNTQFKETKLVEQFKPYIGVL